MRWIRVVYVFLYDSVTCKMFNSIEKLVCRFVLKPITYLSMHFECCFFAWIPIIAKK